VPLSSREMLIIMRARDEASRVIREIGRGLGVMGAQGQVSAGQVLAASAALTATGASMVALGSTGLRTLNGMTNAAIEFDQQAALTLTQVDQVGVSLEDIKDIAKNVAKEIPAPFDQMQAALYDIFSSMDVNTTQAQAILEGFSKAAVAGQVDIQTAGRATISIMNSYGLSVDDLNHILDVQFQLVRKGVGTYDEFASSIGLATPAAVSAGQSVESLAGMLAFLTRNGLSASRAATSAGRALETFANPDVQKRLQNMGVATTDLLGNFRPIADVMTDLGRKLDGMTKPEKVAALQALLAGAGSNVQARRFWNLAIENFDQLNSLTDDMVNSSGAMSNAYDIMFGQPQTKIQQMKNEIAILKTEIGDQLLPVKERLLQKVMQLLKAWDNLSAHTKKLIVNIVLLISTLMVVVGTIFIVMGAILGVIALFMFLGATFSGAIIIILAIVAALALLAAAGYEIYKHWDTVGPLLTGIWKDIRDKIGKYWSDLSDLASKYWPEIRDWVVNAAQVAWEKAQEYWGALRDFVIGAWEYIRDNLPPLLQAIWDEITSIWSTIWDFIQPYLQTIWDNMVQMWNAIKDSTSQIWGSIKDNLGPIWDDIVTLFDAGAAKVKQIWGPFWDAVTAVFTAWWNAFKTILQVAWNNMKLSFDVGTDVLKAIWDGFWAVLTNIVIGFWTILSGIVSGGLEVIRGIIDVLTGIITGDWDKVFQGLIHIVEGFWTILKGVVEGGWLIAVKGPLEGAWIILKGLWDAFWGNLREAVDTLMADIKLIWAGLEKAVGDTWRAAFAVLNFIWAVFWGGLKGPVDLAVTAVDEMWNALDRVYIWIRDRWRDIVGWFGAIKDAVPDLGGFFGSVVSHIPGVRAAGGAVAANTPYLVGERGPELFMSGRSGTIIPNQNIGGAGTSINVSIAEGAVQIMGNANRQDVDEALMQFRAELISELRSR
jgi:TP901 family phage tail tape measure protein